MTNMTNKMTNTDMSIFSLRRQSATYTLPLRVFAQWLSKDVSSDLDLDDSVDDQPDDICDNNDHHDDDNNDDHRHDSQKM